MPLAIDFMFLCVYCRDGKTVSLCKYLPCAEQDCICKSSCADSGARRLNGKCVTVHIKLHKGFYHDIRRNILKVNFCLLSMF